MSHISPLPNVCLEARWKALPPRLCSLSCPVDARLPSLLAPLADGRVFAHIKSELGNQFPEIVQMRAGRSVVIVLRDARGELNHDPVSFDPLFGFDFVYKATEFAVKRAAAATATRQVKCTVGFVGRIVHETAGTFVKRLLAGVSGTPLFHEVALHDCDVVFLFHFILPENL
jgi:hypothetical protein